MYQLFKHVIEVTDAKFPSFYHTGQYFVVTTEVSCTTLCHTGDITMEMLSVQKQHLWHLETVHVIFFCVAVSEIKLSSIQT